jgi:hypothetical protein
MSACCEAFPMMVRCPFQSAISIFDLSFEFFFFFFFTWHFFFFFFFFPRFLFSRPEDLESLRSTIVCYFADGSEEFTVMTAVAVRSFLQHTPLIHVGLLTPDRATRDRIMSALPPSELGRVECRITNPRGHLSVRWNATQFKLDIQQWLQSHYDTFVWMDSDTLVFDDLTPFLLRFIKLEDKLVYLVRDHAMGDERFVTKWRQIAGPFAVDVPQACVMAFKRPIVHRLFDAWLEAWNEWITPTPFARLDDPASGAPHSAFCIEQYALALALSRCALGKEVLWFARGSLDVAPTVLPARPQLGGRFPFANDFSERVQRRWSHAPPLVAAADKAALYEDAATLVRFRAGVDSSYDSVYRSSYTSSYAGSYGGRAGYVGDAGMQPLRRVEGLQVEPAPTLVAAPAAPAAPTLKPTTPTGGATGELVAAAQALAQTYPAEQLPGKVRVDVFAGAVYHVYSRWFFYVLQELGMPQ